MESNTPELQIREKLAMVSNRDDIMDLVDLPEEDVQKRVVVWAVRAGPDLGTDIGSCSVRSLQHNAC